MNKRVKLSLLSFFVYTCFVHSNLPVGQFKFHSTSFRYAELLDFNARLIDDSEVELVWRTATEINTSRFEIERSLDGEIWESLGGITAAINSSEIKSYKFIDEHPYNLKSYYRLIEHRMDERQVKFPSLTIDLSELITYNIQIFPNPTTGIFAVQSSAPLLESLEIFDSYGRKIDFTSTYTRINAYKYLIDFTSQKTGIYFLRCNTFVAKLIKQ